MMVPQAEYAVWLTLVFVIGYLYVTESQFKPFLSLVFDYLYSSVMRAITFVLVYPESPVSALFIKFKTDRNARKLAKELNLDQDKEWFK
jgi:hypothetical protein